MEQIKQTAVEWLESEFIKLESTTGIHGIMYKLIEQAKAMETKTDIQELIDRNYAAQLKRGKVTSKIDFYDWIIDIRDEVNELWNSYPKHNSTFDEKELADIILVCLSMSKHYKIDIVKALEEKTKYNEKRED